MSNVPHWSTTAPLPLQAVAVSALPEAQAHDALLPGTRLDEFEIVRVLGAGGFGIVYLALDHVLLRHVAIKEYMPTALAGRGRGAMVSVRSTTLAQTFALGLDSFFSEARMLASFDHPSLVKVHRFWKANGTAYMVMPYYAGQTLKEARREMGAAPDEAWLRAFVEPLLSALELLHGAGVYHRDIAPDNILLLPDGRPVLLDFGSARRVIGDRTQALTAILKPNFAPLEQYADEAGMRQGPWTDLYALGATVHFVLTGQAPTPAVLRAVRDALPALSAADALLFPGVPVNFLATIDWALALAPDDRPQSVAAVRRGFSGEIVPPRPSARHAMVPRLPRPDSGLEFGSTGLEPFVVGDLDLGVAPSVPLPHAAGTATRTRRSGRAALALLALAGVGALGWGASALNAPSAAPSVIATPTAAPPQAAASADAALAVAVPNVDRTPPTMRAAQTIRRTRPAEAPPTGVAKLLAVEPEAHAPRDACPDQGFFALAMCVSRQCALPRWQAHPQCVEARRVAEQRQQRMEQ